MDSLSQAVLGASVAGICAPRGQRRKALLAGAMLGTLPDLDVLIDYDDAVRNFTYHRGFSHSLFVLAPFSVLVWLLLRRWWSPVRESPAPWLMAISLALLTHPLLDAHTAYGTQLFWPLEMPPTMWATIFIIDPIYTLPLLIGAVVAAFRPLGTWSQRALQTGLAVSTLYLGWSWVAQSIVEQHTEDALARMQLQSAPVFITPTPFNTLLWRIVVLAEDGYLEGFDSLVLDEKQVNFVAYDSNFIALENASDVWSVARLRWFARDFVSTEIKDEKLFMSDLRMGQEPFYVFTHVVAARNSPGWKAIPTELIPFAVENRALGETWARIWAE